MGSKTCGKCSHLGQAILTSHLQDSHISFKNSQFWWSHSLTRKFIHLMTLSKVDHQIKRSTFILPSFSKVFSLKSTWVKVQNNIRNKIDSMVCIFKFLSCHIEVQSEFTHYNCQNVQIHSKQARTLKVRQLKWNSNTQLLIL